MNRIFSVMNKGFSNAFYLSLALVALWSVIAVPTAHAQDKLPNSAINFGGTEGEEHKIHYYFGLEGGYGQASGTLYPMNSGMVWGGTGGIEFQKSFGAAITFQHEQLSYSDSGISTGVSQIMLEANVFSLLVLHGGFHVAEVIRSQGNEAIHDLGFGMHLGLDVSLGAHWTAGLSGYWTLVMEQEDHHSLLNLMIPVKYWF